MVRPTQFRKRRVGREVRSGELRGLLWADENEGRADPLPSFCANGAAGRVQGRSDPLPLQADMTGNTIKLLHEVKYIFILLKQLFKL